MRTLIFVNGFPPLIGGVETYSYSIADNLTRLGEDVIVIAPHTEGDLELDREQSFKVIRVAKAFLLRELVTMLLLPAVTIRYRIDRIVCPVIFPCGAIAYLVTRILRTPYFVVAHSGETSDVIDLKDASIRLKNWLRKRFRWLKVKAFKNACAVICVSNYTKQTLVAQGISDHNMAVIYNGVDPDKFLPGSKSARIIERYKLEGRKVILTVARLDHYKGQDMIIRSLPLVLEEVPDAVYLIVGKGPEKDRLEALIEQLGLKGKAHLTGYVPRDELVDYYNTCDVFIMVSRESKGDFEGFGLTYLEANACAKPVIGSKCGGAPEAIWDGKTGILVDPYDVGGIARAIIHILNERDLATKLGWHGRRRIEEELNWAAVTRRLKQVMDRNMGERENGR